MRNILGFLNLAELGIYTAVATSLYKPIFEKDQNKVSEIISLFGFLYRIIGFAILVIGVVVSIFLPNIFAKTDLNYLVLYAAYYTFLTITLVSYFNNYKQVLLAADQRSYVTTRLSNWMNIVKVGLQILYLKYMGGNYYGWLLIELVFGFALRYLINKTMTKQYPWLKTDLRNGRMLLVRYRDVLKKVKQLFAHKLAGFIHYQSSQILVYALTSLTMVTYFTNYTLIFSKVTILINSTLGSNLAGIGNIIAENNPAKIRKVFWEFNALYFWIGGVLVFSFYHIIEPFIVLWLGSEFILPPIVFLIMLINLYFMIVGQTARYFLNGYALFKDVWAPWVEASLNIGIAIGVGYFYGIFGVVLGIAISSLLIVIIWKPYFLFREGFKERSLKYWFNILKYVGLFILAWAILYPLAHSPWIPIPSSFLKLLLFAIIISFPFTILYGALLYFGSPGMKDLCRRMTPVLINLIRHN